VGYLVSILITGGAGFIGSNTAFYLCSRGFKVSVIDSFERSSISFEELLGAGIRVFRGDVKDTSIISSILQGVDVVVHAAAYVDVAESMAKPLEYLNNNVIGTASVASVCFNRGVGLIYISSAAVYGDPIKLPIDEDHPTKPLSPYGLSKLLGEEVVKFYGGLGLRFTILRLFNVYGPRQNRSYAGVITRFIERVKAGLPPVIYGDGLQTRDFVHVVDVAKAVELAIEKKLPQQILNIASGKPVKIKDLAYMVIKLSGLDKEPIYTNPRPGDIKHSWGSIAKAEEQLNYKPSINLEEGLKNLYENWSF